VSIIRYDLSLVHLLFLHYLVVVVMIIVIIVIVIVVRRKRGKSRAISSMVMAKAPPKTISQSEIEMKIDETIKNVHYTQTPATAQENIYDNPEHLKETSENPADSFDSPTTTEVNHVYDVPKVKKVSTSSLSFVKRKESSAKYERLDSVEEPGDGP